MNKLLLTIITISMLATTLAGCTNDTSAPSFKWNKLPVLPDSYGFAGAFSGVSNGALIVAGGANFPDGGTPWAGSKKVWHDSIFVLESADSKWKIAGRLPKPLGYGVSLTWNNNLVCIGGSDASGHYADGFILKYANGKIETESLPKMPEAISNACGALIGDVVYVAGGLKHPDDKTAANNFWSLDLSAKDRSWQVLQTWPGEARMLSVAGGLDGAFYLFSGVALNDGNRAYLKDAYKYEPGKGWTKISDLPAPVAAAPSPAYSSKGQLSVFGGDDGQNAAAASELKEKHPGFSTKILSYTAESDSWMNAGTVLTEKLPDAAANPNASTWAPVTTPLVIWNNDIIMPSGEVRPAVRTPNVIRAILK